MRGGSAFAGLTLGALLLAGCADSSVRAPEVRLPAAFENAPGQGALSPAVLDRWWTLFPGDTQLQALVEEALQSAPDARTAMARVEEARATRAQRFASLLPQGNLTGAATRQHTEQNISGSGGGGFSTPGDLTTLSARFDPTWEIDLFGRSRVGRRVANEDFAAARFDAEATRMVLAADVARSLFQARTLAVQLQDAEETARIARELARISGIRAERGLGTRADAARVQSDLQSAEAEILRLQAQLESSRRSLLVLLGRGTDPSGSLPIEARVDEAPALPTTAPADLLARRPDVREAEARLRVAADTARLSGLALLPKFTLQPTGSISHTSGAYSATTTVWSLGVGAMLPVLDRPRLLAALRADRARGEQAVIAFERAVQTAYGNAENAMTVVEADRGRVERLTTAESNARFAYGAAQRGYQAGLTDITSLLDAERAWRGARSALTAARAQALQNVVAAFQALGGGWTFENQQTAQADLAR